MSQQMREDMSLTRARVSVMSSTDFFFITAQITALGELKIFFCFVPQLQNELETQCRATEFALRKRNHQEEQARDELQWQIKKVRLQMSGECVGLVYSL